MGMTFTEDKFYNLGLVLARSPREARRRTGVGRLYYSIHWAARHFLAPSGFVAPTFQAHKAVIHELRKSHPGLADQVKDLRRLRERADYELSPSLTTTERDDAVAIASFLWGRLR